MAYSHTSLILVSTEQTRCALPWAFRKRAVIYSNLGIDAISDAKPCSHIEGEPLRVLFAGRLLGWKGIHLAIRALAAARNKGANVELIILGSGPYAPVLKNLAATQGVEQFIRWREKCPQSELFALYRSMHAFIFPSLHDSGGTVVLEAQANGLPVICLDLGGPATLVTPESAIVVSTFGCGEAAVVHGLADALMKLAGDENARMAMAHAAIAHAKNMSWENRVNGALTLLEGTGHGN